MILPNLADGRILKRYKRFLADVALDDGTVITAHCANTGSMESCWKPGAPVQVSDSRNPKRKLRWSLERIDMGGGWIGVNTMRVNGVIGEGIETGRIPMLAGYRSMRREPVYQATGMPRSRFDFALAGGAASAECLVEVKNATLLLDGVIQFPDAVTIRGLKHLDLLEIARIEGFRACLVFALNRPETTEFQAAETIDPAYAARLSEVARAGVEVIIARLAHLEDRIEVQDAWRW
ncbi:MAG: DNA/RNA nuclease SfsA [Proteobacteria bacterium]|nr:MAG: DNA/RNA nuclease SfsA [Pseudomonadota bacterium]